MNCIQCGNPLSDNLSEGDICEQCVIAGIFEKDPYDEIVEENVLGLITNYHE